MSEDDHLPRVGQINKSSYYPFLKVLVERRDRVIENEWCHLVRPGDICQESCKRNDPRFTLTEDIFWWTRTFRPNKSQSKSCSTLASRFAIGSNGQPSTTEQLEFRFKTFLVAGFYFRSRKVIVLYGQRIRCSEANRFSELVDSQQPIAFCHNQWLILCEPLHALQFADSILHLLTLAVFQQLLQ